MGQEEVWKGNVIGGIILKGEMKEKRNKGKEKLEIGSEVIPCMSSWNILRVININSLFTFHGHAWSFYTRTCS